MLNLDKNIENEIILIENLKEAIDEMMVGIDDKEFIDIEKLFIEADSL